VIEWLQIGDNKLNEAEWLQSGYYLLLTYFVAERMSLRKLRLANVAICRRVERHLVDERDRHALAVGEDYADGLVSEDELAEAHAHANAVYESLRRQAMGREAYFWAILYLCWATAHSGLRMQIDAIDVVLYSSKPPDSIPPEHRADAVAEAELARDVFGNPFRPVAFDPAWRTEDSVGIALKLYEERDFSSMPILADALMDAGCDNNDILNHCRSDKPHVRGCWVVDLVLGKE
jgi:hypothetical protein